MLNELAPAAASEPPIMVATISHKEGVPFSATNIVGTVVINKVRIIPGFVKAKKEFTLKRIESGLLTRIILRLWVHLNSQTQKNWF
tara:strand:+ start:908 stop:1165 length:258 start_codon:yes stop_codon:yes gene_type:complete